ncbi:MAG: hypothetical protein O7E49_14925, partial [Gemmatimonadetes bacterium]|nr:hypothetical protein [Gemmatimonadota bacterium]
MTEATTDTPQQPIEDIADEPILRVRADLYDESYSDEEYQQMLAMYEGTMASIAEGEIVTSKVLRITD